MTDCQIVLFDATGLSLGEWVLFAVLLVTLLAGALSVWALRRSVR